MKFEIEIHPAKEKPNRSGWYIVMDIYRKWRKAYYDRRAMLWDPQEICYWSELPDEKTLNLICARPKASL